MTHEEKIKVCEEIDEYRMKIKDLDIKLRDDKLTTQEFYFISDLRKDLNGVVETHLSFLETCKEEGLASLTRTQIEKPPAKKPFVERYLIPLLFAEGILTLIIMYIWRH
jgi:hypothetical protein